LFDEFPSQADAWTLCAGRIVVQYPVIVADHELAKSKRKRYNRILGFAFVLGYNN
jgi:hypothetical protein